MPFRPPGNIQWIDPSTVRLGPLTPVPPRDRTAAVSALRAGVLGPYPILLDLDKDLQALASQLHNNGGDWSKVSAVLVDRLIANTLGETLSLSNPGKLRPDRLVEQTAQQFRDIAIHDCGADTLP